MYSLPSLTVSVNKEVAIHKLNAFDRYHESVTGMLILDTSSRLYVNNVNKLPRGSFNVDTCAGHVLFVGPMLCTGTRSFFYSK